MYLFICITVSIFHPLFQEVFTAIVYPNGNVFVYLEMVKAIKIIVIIKKYKSCEDKELKLKNFSLRACIPGRPQPHPPTPHCLSKLVLQNINKTELINIFGEVELKIRLK